MKLSYLLVAAYRKVGRSISRFAPISSILTLIGLIVALVGFVIEMEDRQSERIFRAWDFVIQNELMMRQFEDDQIDVLPPNVNIASAIEYLNRDFDGAICGDWIVEISKALTGNQGRRCILPKKRRSVFTQRFFRGANLNKTRLDAAIFTEADLESADLNRASLREAKFNRANLWKAHLNHAKLHKANLRNSCLEKADFENAELTRAKLQSSVAVKADFENAILHRSKLGNANLSGSILRGADFYRADLSGTNLFMADVSGAKFQEATNLRRFQVLMACISEGEPGPRLPKEIGEVNWSNRLCSRSEVELTKCPKHR